MDDEQKYANYIGLVKTIEFLDKSGRITEDWMETHKQRILEYRDWIPNYSVINPEVEGHEFRYNCDKVEEMIQYSCDCIRIHKTFDVRVYRAMLSGMKYICDEIMTEAELIQCMELLTF
jgi:hypothetical protein